METNAQQQKICCITGRRPDGFPFSYGDNPATRTYRRQLKRAIVYLIEEQKVVCFITGGALGVDLDVAEIVLALQKTYPFVTHRLALPYENQAGRYAPNDKIRHERVKKSSNVVVLADHYTPWCMQQRNVYMVDNAHVVAAFVSGEKTGGTYNTIRYAKRKKKPVYVFNLDSCQTSNSKAWIKSAEQFAAEQLHFL